MAGTRVSVLTKFIDWVNSDPIRIFWLAGMAGTGKTSIAVTLCRMLHDDPGIILGGTFFCSLSAGSVHRTEVRCILPTLATSLASLSPEFATALAANLKADPRIAHKPVSLQVDPLLVKPLVELASSARPIVFVIDALDECSNDGELAELLAAIADFETDAKVKFILTSRPEMHIRGTSISDPNHNTILQLHTISEKEVTADIRRYITGTLLTTVTSDTTWFTDGDIDVLVKLSHGLFIFASTALLYVRARENAKGRRERLCKMTSAAGAESAALVSLDKIYELIVLEAARSDAVDADELHATQRVLACILAARTLLSVQALADLLGVEIDDVRGALERLHSVIYMPSEDGIAGVRVLHASFGDYILSRAAQNIRIPASLGDDILARGCLNVMAEHLHFNIAQVQNSHQGNGSTRLYIRLSLEYACLQWVFHVSELSTSSTLDAVISKVICSKFLFWLEVISTLGQVNRATTMLILASTSVSCILGALRR